MPKQNPARAWTVNTQSGANGPTDQPARLSLCSRSRLRHSYKAGISLPISSKTRRPPSREAMGVIRVNKKAAFLLLLHSSFAMWRTRLVAPGPMGGGNNVRMQRWDNASQMENTELCAVTLPRLAASALALGASLVRRTIGRTMLLWSSLNYMNMPRLCAHGRW